MNDIILEGSIILLVITAAIYFVITAIEIYEQYTS